jgi:hypothetical protein
MILTFRRAIDSRSGSTTIMFAAFAAALTIGVMMLGKSVSQKMVTAVNYTAPIRY